MEKKNIEKPVGGADEATIEKNLEKMEYPASEDIMQQNEAVDADLQEMDKQTPTV
jgi:hypothetical protein